MKGGIATKTSAKNNIWRIGGQAQLDRQDDLEEEYCYTLKRRFQN